jgi:Taurine catabolism dioxygenase TauD, TfdA family
VDDCCRALRSDGFALVEGPFGEVAEAFAVAGALVAASQSEDGQAPLPVIGDFVLPPPDGEATRDFQTLHFDFGLPLDPKLNQDVARFTALYVPVDVAIVSAVTRLVPLVALLGQRAWPPGAQLVASLIAYGRTHGAWDDARGYSEGSLARIVEAAAGSAPVLPSVKSDPGFLCGLEFDSLASELAFFERHELHVERVAIDVALKPGELLVFDNLALAHGRRGTRRPGELRQRIFGHRRLAPDAQRQLRDRVLGAFDAAASAEL